MKTVLVTYDIKDNKRRKKVADILLDHGLHRIEYSAYYGTMDPILFYKMCGRIEKQIEDEDIIHIFFIVGSIKENIILMGDAYLPEDRSVYIY